MACPAHSECRCRWPETSGWPAPHRDQLRGPRRSCSA
jgi:hypothetical protein